MPMDEHDKASRDRALRESEERFASFAASSSDALWIRDARTYVYQFVNPAVEAIYGVTPEAVLADPELINNLILPEQRWPISANVARISRGEKIVHEYQIRRPTDGAIRWIRSTGFPLLDADGQVGRIAAIASDITERKLADLALRESEERQVFLLKLTDALGPSSDLVEIREIACRLLGEAVEADRCYFVEFVAASDGGYGIVADDYRRNGLPSLAGRYPFEVFRTTYERVARGGPWIVADVTQNGEIATAEATTYESQGVMAWVDIPLLVSGQLRAVLCVVHSKPRSWAERETALIEQTAERLWLALERARAEAELRESERTLRIALEAGRMGTYRFDVHTGIEQWSDSEFEMMGLRPTAEAPTRELFLSLVHPEDRDRVEFSSNDERPEGTPLNTEFRIIRPDTGEVRWIIAHALALFGADGKPSELIGVNIDVTEQRKLEAAMHTSEERLREFGEAMTDVMWIRRASDLQWEYLSPAFHKIYGISRQDALPGDNYLAWAELIVDEDREYALASIDRVRRGERVTFEYRIRRPEDGQIRWLRNTDFPMRDEAGNIVRIGGIGHDITPLKQAEEHQKVLTAELQHRVRNTLSVIRSIARRSAGSSGAVDEFAMNLEGRIDAFARVQAVVTRDPAAGVDLAMLIAEELRAASAHEGENLSIEGPDVTLRAKPAETLALGIHELVTNAIKHGALLREGGHIAVSWAVTDTDLRLRWKESGLQLNPDVGRMGLGIEILTRTLPYELGGKARLEREPDGLVYEITMPVTATQSKGGRNGV